MAETPLHSALAAAGARFGEFAGVQTAASFGDLAKEFAALRSGAGVFDLGGRAKIIVSGNDRVRWMNGMVTNNVRDLAAGRGNYNFLLNAQGHILADMYIYNRGEHLMVDTDTSQAATVLQLFDKYIIMDEVEAEDASAKLTALGVGGPKAEEILAKIGLAAPKEPLAVQDAEWQGAGVSVVRSDARGGDRLEIWVAPAHAERLWKA